MSRVADHGPDRQLADEGGTRWRILIPVSISDIKDMETPAALFEVDSDCGRGPSWSGRSGRLKWSHVSSFGCPLKDLHGPSGTRRKK